MYRELGRQAVRKASRAMTPGGGEQLYGRGRAEATAWCRSRAVETDEAVRRVTGGDASERFAEAFASELERAQARAAACPVAMGGPGNLELLFHLAEGIEARRVIETGVAYGWSTLALQLSLARREGARLISTDMPYPQRGNDDYVGVVVPEELRSRWTLLAYPDRDALPKALRLMPELDMCHYDSDKSYDGRMWAYPRLWNALRPGGLFVSDDVADDVAFRDFCAALGREPAIVASHDASEAAHGLDATKYAGVLVK
jgi:predicted O-methyltransferase YrrM